jgi:AcrR family transcriptional regulator
MRCIDRRGPTVTTLSDVAAELSVTRQTVYRYFPGTDELFLAVGQVAVATFIDELTAHLRWRTEPDDWVVERWPPPSNGFRTSATSRCSWRRGGSSRSPAG